MRSSKKKTARLGGLSALHQGRAGRHGGREPQDRQVEHLFITADARGKGWGRNCWILPAKAAGARAPGADGTGQKYPGHCLYRRMGWKVCGVAEVFDPAKDGSVTARAELLEMRYEVRQKPEPDGEAGRKPFLPKGAAGCHKRTKPGENARRGRKNVENFCVTPITFRE